MRPADALNSTPIPLEWFDCLNEKEGHRSVMRNTAPTDAAQLEALETREWLDSLDDVLKHGGPARVGTLLRELGIHAQKSGVRLPFTAPDDVLTEGVRRLGLAEALLPLASSPLGLLLAAQRERDPVRNQRVLLGQSLQARARESIGERRFDQFNESLARTIATAFDVEIEDVRARLESRLRQRPPVVTTSARTGRGIARVLDRVAALLAAAPAL